MDNLPSEFHKTFTEKFFELFKLYSEVKKIVFLAEYENKEQKYIISSVNELRNTLDHIMRSFDSPESLEKNFDKAKGHLYRAGYDGYEIIAVSKLAAIKEIKEQFRFEAITIAYPDYFTKVIPLIAETKELLISARANKKIDNGLLEETEEKHYQLFEKIATNLMKVVDDIELHIEGIKEAHQQIINKENEIRIKELEDKKEQARLRRKNNLTIGIIAPIIIGLIVGIFMLNMEFLSPKTIVPHLM
jgi:hypothetical protein